MRLSGAPALRVFGLGKSFGATVALSNASFAVARGEVHALLGENGAGKSTTVKLLSGLLLPDRGTLELFGKPVVLKSPAIAHAHGVQTAFQELSLIRDLTVAETMLMPYAPRGLFGQLKRRQGLERVAAHLASVGLGHIDPMAEVAALELPERQKIEIARALLRSPRILLLDEPTSTMSGRDIDWLGEHLERLQADGITVVFISHRMPEVRRFCDRLTVLRNGKSVGTHDVHEVSDDDVIRMIIGRSLASTFPPRLAPRPAGKVVLRGSELATRAKLRRASFALHQGEILGIAGLQGMGQRSLFNACFGAEPLDSGKLYVDEREVLLASPKDAIARGIGISLVPEERKTEGLLLNLSGRFNVSLPVVERFVKFGLIDTVAETAAVAVALRQVDIAERALYQPATAFSGGNQQKLVIAKWLLAQSRILLLFDPTRGVDVGTKHQIYHLMREFVAAGGAILFYSSEIPEIVGLGDRVLVLYQGEVVAQLEGEAIGEETIMRAALGQGDSSGAAA
jgi:ribose transport system ATP-binding protein